MGTNNETVELQSHIKILAANLGWSQNRLARVLYTEIHDWDNDEEIFKFQEKLKKELQRGTTKVEKLQRYLEILVNHPELQKLDVVFNKHVPQGAISSSLSRGIGEISKEIDNACNKALQRTAVACGVKP